jgi:DNA-binding protein Fis
VERRMITVLFTDNTEKVKEILSQMLAAGGNFQIGIVRQENVIRIFDRDDFRSVVTLKEKLLELEDALFEEKKGVLYRSLMDALEKPLIEHVLQRTEGNQLKAARILGVNRNTIRAKIKKLDIHSDMFR